LFKLYKVDGSHFDTDQIQWTASVSDISKEEDGKCDEDLVKAVAEKISNKVFYKEYSQLHINKKAYMELVISNCLKGYGMDKKGKQNEAKYLKRRKKLKTAE
jgi:hypothetical protein